MKGKELKWTQLKRKCNTRSFNFNDTSEVNPSKDLIGQDRVVKALQFGLRNNLNGYNIYMSGESGEGKTSYAVRKTKEIALTMKTPDDWCYIYNFKNANNPIAVNLPAGKGKEFKEDMELFAKIVDEKLMKAFDGENYENERNKVIKKFKDRKDELVKQLDEDAQQKGFKVRITNPAIYFLPIIDGEVINEEQYKELDEETKIEINNRSDELQNDTIDIIRQIKEVEKDAEETLEEWEEELVVNIVSDYLEDFGEKYRNCSTIQDYFEDIKKDIIENLDSIRGTEYTEEQQQLLPFIKKTEEDPFDKYKVNLLVDNSNLKGAPVIVDYNPTFYNLMGRVEYENEFGTLSPDYTMVQSGLFPQANGGFLVLQAHDVLNNPQSWEAIKRTLKTKTITIENIKEQMGLVVNSTLKPQSIPADIKVILIGSHELYQMLYVYDRDFKKMFKIKADFDSSMKRTKENVNKLCSFISAYCEKEGVLHFDRSGVAEVIDYCSRVVEDQDRLTTKFNQIVDILAESATWAAIDKKELVSRQYVKKAIVEKEKRSNKYDRDLLELIKEGSIMIDTDGEKIGQINGLSIIDVGDYSFGKPSRITAATYIGESGVVNIEREVEMSGVSHAKGVLILSGYIGSKYAQDMPLSVSASICFEQLYSGVDGDSASSTELYAILSSIAEVPIKQGLAVTGSVNQNGEIQPIGGVTSKIEGFFELCKLRGLTGEQGVIIPIQNVKNLVLKEEVISAVKQNKFHIYPIKHVDEGIEILTGVKAGGKTKEGVYELNTINYLVDNKLKKYARIVKEMKD